MEVGIVYKLDSEHTYIKTKYEIVSIKNKDVFKYDLGKPATPLFNADWIQAKFGAPTGSLKNFLDGAAKIFSLKDYRKMITVEKIKQ